MLSDYDLVVVGGGPAGTAAAITAARRGARVLLLERGRYPRHKVCGEFISPESLDLLRELLRDEVEGLAKLEAAPRIVRARVWIGGQRFEARVEPAAASLARHELDAMLWRAAERAGVEARQGVEVKRISPSHGSGEHGHEDASQFVVTTADRQVQASAVVNAAGRSPRAGGGPVPAEARWIGLKAHFAAPAPLSPVTELYCFDGGYCGVQPVAGAGVNTEVHVNVCALVRAGAARTLDDVLRQHRGLQERSAGWRQVTRTSATAALSFAPPCPVRDGVLMAGDAAGFIDPFVGDGIAIALRSGAMAAEAATPAEYARRYHAAFDGAFRNAARLRRLMERPGAARTAALALLRLPGAAEFVVRKTRSG